MSHPVVDGTSLSAVGLGSSGDRLLPSCPTKPGDLPKASSFKRNLEVDEMQPSGSSSNKKQRLESEWSANAVAETVLGDSGDDEDPLHQLLRNKGRAMEDPTDQQREGLLTDEELCVRLRNHSLDEHSNFEQRERTYLEDYMFGWEVVLSDVTLELRLRRKIEDLIQVEKTVVRDRLAAEQRLVETVAKIEKDWNDLLEEIRGEYGGHLTRLVNRGHQGL